MVQAVPVNLREAFPEYHFGNWMIKCLRKWVDVVDEMTVITIL